MISSLFALGTYTSLGGPGIRVFRLENERLRTLYDIFIEDPIWLELSPDKKHLYAACGGEGPEEGFIASFSPAEDAFEAGLRLEARQECQGVCPCHLGVCGNDLISANYNSGSISVFALIDGVPQPMRQLIRHSGSGPNPARQHGPHVHQVLPMAEDMFQAIDLGTDRLVRYRKADKDWKPDTQIACPAGDGPRHALFSHDAMYLVTELGSRLHVYHAGRLTETHMLPGSGKDGDNYPAAIRLSPDQKTLAVSNRGAECLTFFRVEDGGALTYWKDLPVLGSWPRDFVFADEQTLLSANQHSGEVQLLRLEGDSIRVLDTMHVSAPVSLLPL